MFPELIKDPPDGFHVRLTGIFGLDQDVVLIHYDEDVELLGEGLVDVALKTGGSIGEAKRHDLVLKVTVSGPKGRLPFIAFSNSHPMVGAGQVKLDEALSSAQVVQGLINQGQRVPILDGQIGETSVIDTQAKATVWLPEKKNGSSSGGLGRPDKPIFRLLSM